MFWVDNFQNVSKGSFYSRIIAETHLNTKVLTKEQTFRCSLPDCYVMPQFSIQILEHKTYMLVFSCQTFFLYFRHYHIFAFPRIAAFDFIFQSPLGCRSCLLIFSCHIFSFLMSYAFYLCSSAFDFLFKTNPVVNEHGVPLFLEWYQIKKIHIFSVHIFFHFSLLFQFENMFSSFNHITVFSQSSTVTS